MQSTNLTSQAKQGRINQRPVPKITLISLLFVPPISHLVPTECVHKLTPYLNLFVALRHGSNPVESSSSTVRSSLVILSEAKNLVTYRVRSFAGTQDDIV